MFSYAYVIMQKSRKKCSLHFCVLVIVQNMVLFNERLNKLPLRSLKEQKR